MSVEQTARTAIEALSAFLHDPEVEGELSPAEVESVHEVMGLVGEWE